LSLSPLMFVLFALSIAAGGLTKRWALAVAAVSAFLGYSLLQYGGYRLANAGAVPAYASAWAPNVTLALVAALLTLRQPRVSVDDEPAR
jgi:lipopolysaccharide export LptBFGC system permease protein LptF